ncbi:MAG TPA: glycosyltransferase family 4 protein [Candidatus Obscuribacterales bacterium]
MVHSSASSSTLKVTVLQAGARMHYAVPSLLASAGLLQHFYTDIHGTLPGLRLLHHLPPALQPAALQRLLGRSLPNTIASNRVTTCGRSLLWHRLRSRWGRVSGSPHGALFQKAIARRFDGANVLYSNFINADLTAFQAARQQGLRTVHEAIISPEIPYLLDEERRAFPGLEPLQSLDQMQAGTERDRQKWELSDVILVPSPYVQQAMERLGVGSDRIHLVPYGLAADWLTATPTPRPGRILFVGSVRLLKGCHYLAAATRLLQQRGVPCEVRVVGAYQPEAIAHPAFQGPTYVGPVPRSQIQQEFLQADCLVFPTLCDSFGLVQLEAIACGLPVITTPHCGSVVRDGVEGFIVPIRDAEALADRMEHLVSDRLLREQMSVRARQRAQDFTWQQYGDRLIAALQTLDLSGN